MIVGRLARMRRSSTMFCWSSIGTLKSTRTRTRFPARSRSPRPSFATLSSRSRVRSRSTQPWFLRRSPRRAWRTRIRCRTTTTTFTMRLPSTVVDLASNTDECGLPMMSLETSGSSEYSRMPASGGLLAACAHRGVDLVFGDVALQRRHQIHHRAVRHRHPHRHAVQAAGELRQHLADGRRRAGRRRDDVDGSPRAPAAGPRAADRECAGRWCTRARSSSDRARSRRRRAAPSPPAPGSSWCTTPPTRCECLLLVVEVVVDARPRSSGPRPWRAPRSAPSGRRP